MRDILFRGKRIDNGEWVEGYVFDDGFLDSKRMFVGGLVIMDYKGTADDRWDVGTAFYEVSPDTICQYTGLTDKNGNKIWENDILIYDNSPYSVYCTPHKGEIVCRNGCLCFKYWLYGSTNYMPFTADVFFDKKSEVIGNVFDNKELLEE